MSLRHLCILRSILRLCRLLLLSIRLYLRLGSYLRVLNILSVLCILSEVLANILHVHINARLTIGHRALQRNTALRILLYVLRVDL